MLVPDSTCLLSSTIVPVSCYIHPDMQVYDQSSQLIQTHTPRLKCRPTFIIPLEQWYCSHQGQFSPPLMTARSLPILRVATAGPTQGWHQRSARRSYVTAICKLNMTNRFPTSPLATSGPLRRKTERWTRRRSSPQVLLKCECKGWQDSQQEGCYESQPLFYFQQNEPTEDPIRRYQV